VIDGTVELVRRIARLDGERGGSPSVYDPNADLTWFVEVLSEVTNPGKAFDVRQIPCASPRDADDLFAGCRLLRRLVAAAPEVVCGPLQPERQFWVATRKPRWEPPGACEPRRSSFVPVAPEAAIELSTKPFGHGLFTSTGVLGTVGMWRLYLELYRDASPLRLPWHTWLIGAKPNSAVKEVTTAAEWVEFVRSYPQPAGSLLFPNWRAIAADYDAVHMTIRAIGATQGIGFPTEDGIVAAPYWDVESTFWLRWSFDVATLIEVSNP